MITQHTPGPWRAGSIRGDLVDCIYSADSIRVATIETWIGPKESAESEANARLIAAAPDLLAALQRAYVDIATRKVRKGDGAILALLRTVIAKATGGQP